MGKAQNGSGKRKQRRHNPVRVPDSHLGSGVKIAEQTSDKTGQVIPVLEKLESSDVSDRRWACAAVTNLIQNDASTRRLLQAKGVVDKLITRLSDTDEEVIAEAAGSLRNLAVDGGYDMCAHMFNKNVLAQLKNFVPKISLSLQGILGPSPTKVTQSHKIRIFELSENLITLFWCLSETSHKAMNALNDANLTPFLISFLSSRDNIPIKTVVAAAQCLYVMSDDNDTGIRAIKQSAYVSCLMDIVQSDVSHLPDGVNKRNDKSEENEQAIALKVLTCGILKNISPLILGTPSAPIDLERDVLLPLLVPLLSYPLNENSSRVQVIMESFSAGKASRMEENLAPRPDHKTIGEIELSVIESKLRTVALALEILTSICAKLPEPTVTEEPPFDEEEEEMEAEETDETSGVIEDDDDELDMDEAPAVAEIYTNKPAFKILNYLSLVASLTQPLLALSSPNSLSFPSASAPSIHPPTTSALSKIHVRALECLNNLFLGLDFDSLSLPPGTAEQATDVWLRVWAILRAVGTHSEWSVGSGAEIRKDMWDIGMGVLWGLAKLANGTLVPDIEQVQMLMGYCTWSDNELVKVKCIGALAGIAQRGDAIEANKIISIYLFSYLTDPLPSSKIAYPEAILHAASSLIDIYAEEEKPYDINFREMHGTELLFAAKDRVKRAGRSVDVKKEGAHETKLFAAEVLENVVGFVQYRRKLERKWAKRESRQL